VAEVQRHGHKITAERVVRIGRDRIQKIVWLEDGLPHAGVGHILNPKRVAEFRAAGVDEVDIVDLVFAAATTGTPIGVSGRDRVVFALDYRGQPRRVAVTVADNGFIVGGKPISMHRKVKPLP